MSLAVGVNSNFSNCGNSLHFAKIEKQTPVFAKTKSDARKTSYFEFKGKKLRCPLRAFIASAGFLNFFG